MECSTDVCGVCIVGFHLGGWNWMRGPGRDARSWSSSVAMGTLPRPPGTLGC